MNKEMIQKLLKEQGYRITKQRMMLLDIILENECSCCKEIYYKASKRDPKIGVATVYRMVNTLEEIGAINRQNAYKVCDSTCENRCNCQSKYTIYLDDDTVLELSPSKWKQVVESGLSTCGYTKRQNVKKIVAGTCSC